MDQNTYLEFYANTVDEFCAQMKRQVSAILENEHLITFNEQRSIEDNEDCLYFPKKDYNKILNVTAKNINFLQFYDKFDFVKMYKYSIPFFYEGDIENKISELLKNKEEILEYSKLNEASKYSIASNFKEVIPVYYKIDDKRFIVKFVFQKSYYKENGEQVDYRYIVVVYFDENNKLLEIRYDSLKYSPTTDNRTIYMNNIESTIDWLKNKLGLKLYRCNDEHFLDIIKKDENNEVKIFKQMMDMGSSGAAELTASQDEDFILPFIGEIQELINENEELFNQNKEIKDLLQEYIKEKEATASYPYVYLMWKRAVASKSFIVKITFSYFDKMYIQLQHITGTCTDFRMERMNDAIEFFGSSGAFIKGKEI